MGSFLLRTRATSSRPVYDKFIGLFLRIAASGWIPASWFETRLPPLDQRAARRGRLSLEITSHCWQYAHLLVYQLSSLITFPPRNLDVTMTVYYSEEDLDTRNLLERFGEIEVPGVRWNWRPMPRENLFRRAVGRNDAALATEADWIWFTDCDLMFGEGCLDALAESLQGCREALYFPAVERCTSLLLEDNPLLNPALDSALPLRVDTTVFTERKRDRATGPLQITHGDVARACGYCRALDYYQQPADTWRKAYEDRAFRWLLRTPGMPLDIPGVYRIRHASKGRYMEDSFVSLLRGSLRRVVSSYQEWRARS